MRKRVLVFVALVCLGAEPDLTKQQFTEIRAAVADRLSGGISYREVSYE